MRKFDEYKSTNNRTVYKRLRYDKVLDCSFCPPHRNENGHWKKPRKKKEFQLKGRNYATQRRFKQLEQQRYNP